MRTLLAFIFSHKPVLLVGSFAWGWVEVAFFPQPMLLVWLGACMFVNMVTGVMKSWRLGVGTHREGLQKTIVKISRYSSLLIAFWVMINIIDRIDHIEFDYTGFINSIIVFLSFVELYSIFENVQQLDPDGPLSPLINAILKFLNRRKDQIVRQFDDTPDKPKNNTNENSNSV